MNPEPTPASPPVNLVRLPVQAPPEAPDTPALVQRLIDQFGACWVDESTLDTWAAAGGDRVLLFTGDTSRFPEGLDVAVVLPELQRAHGGRFQIGLVPRASEERLARRFGSQRWPTLVFLRDGGYVGALSGMHDWEDFVRLVGSTLDQPVGRVPGIGIPVVASGAAAGDACH